MKKPEIFNTLTRSFYKTGFQLKKHSPEILVVSGVVGVVASAVMACKATMKVNPVLEETKENLEIIHSKSIDPNMAGRYSEEDHKKELTVVYTQTGFKLVKLYAPSVVLGAASLACILTSNDILRKRNAAIAAAYAVVDKGFKDYRSRVVERFGQEVDKELKYNLRKEEIEETVVDEKGKEKKIKKTVNVVNPSDLDEFSRLFDELNPNHVKNADYNKSFLTMRQQYANDLLVSRGYLFLNEVYEMLGYEPTIQGQCVGWVYDSKDEGLDNYVDFGMLDMRKERTRDFIHGYEYSVLLDFNHQGYILDDLKEKGIMLTK